MDSLPKNQENRTWIVSRTNNVFPILRWYNNPLLQLLKFYGVDVFGDNICRKYFLKSICSLLPLCIIVLFMCAVIGNCTVTLPCAWSTEGFYPFFFTILSCAIEAVIAALTLLKIFTKKRLLGTLMTSLGEILEKDKVGKGQKEAILWWFSWGICVFLGLNTIVHFIFHSYIFVVLNPTDLYQRFTNCLVFEISSLAESLIMDLWVLVIQNFLFVAMSIFTYVCILITLCFRTINNSPCSSLPVMQQRHQQLCSLVSKADAVFSSVAFLWYLQIVAACCWIRALSNPFLGNHRFYFVQVAGLFVEYALSTLIVSCAGHAVNEEVIKTIPSSSSCVHLYPLSHEEAMLNEIKSLSYFTLTSNSPPALTVMNMFAIRKALILNITGTIITYSIILFEMRQ